jgi:hypothetical protein
MKNIELHGEIKSIRKEPVHFFEWLEKQDIFTLSIKSLEGTFDIEFKSETAHRESYCSHDFYVFHKFERSRILLTGINDIVGIISGKSYFLKKKKQSSGNIIVDFLFDRYFWEENTFPLFFKVIEQDIAEVLKLT